MDQEVDGYTCLRMSVRVCICICIHICVPKIPIHTPQVHELLGCREEWSRLHRKDRVHSALAEASLERRRVKRGLKGRAATFEVLPLLDRRGRRASVWGSCA